MKKPSDMSKEELIARLDAAYAEIKPQTDIILSEHRADMIARFVRDHSEDLLDFENGYTLDAVEYFKDDILQNDDEQLVLDCIRYAKASTMMKDRKFFEVEDEDEDHELMLNSLMIAAGAGNDKIILDFILVFVTGYIEKSKSLKPL